VNIFITSKNPKTCAKVLDDKRVVKMVLESAQLLSTAMHVLKIKNPPYRSTHINHPCAIFTRKTRGNFNWVFQHFIVLCEEYQNRYGKIHRCFYLANIFKRALPFVPQGRRTPFVNCTQYKELKVYEAYRKTMVDKWLSDKRPPTWRGRKQPRWFSGLVIR
jgi:hypothetical protein